MISLSSIKNYMYCPRKLYIQENMINEESNSLEFYNELKRVRMDINELIYRNMRQLKSKMIIKEIESTLSSEIPEYIENRFDDFFMGDYGLADDEMEDYYSDLIDQTYFDIKLLAIKSKKAMQLLDKEGIAIADMFFPSCLYNHYMNDTQLDIVGIADKIEIIDGMYYPVIYKNTVPPLTGVWDSDAIELASLSLLIENEFDSEVFIGFVEYQKLGERRTVVIDVNIRKALFEVINEISEVKLSKRLPKVKINKNKCRNCKNREICEKED